VGQSRGSGVLDIANYNSPTQVVISGQNDAVDRAVRLVNEGGLGRAVELNVSAPFHSSIMRPVADEFGGFLAEFGFRSPRMAFIDNVTGLKETDPANIKKKLVLQLSNPVQWEKSVIAARDAGGSTFIESGPGTVLVGLARRIVREAKIVSGEKLLKDS
jgi:[acyl-carrier-protein] S-malonyltransferase